MATLSVLNPTLADHAKTLDPDGKPARIIQLLNQTNEILADMPVVEGNLPTGHLTTVQTALPEVALRLINGGVLPSKGTTQQITEAIAMFEAFSQVDKDLALMGGDIGAFRMSQARPFLEAMNQKMATTLFYGNSGTTPESFTGFAPRYSSLSAGNAQNIIDAGGTGGDNASIWLVAWDEESITGIYPKGSSVGLLHEDRGETVIQNANGVTGALMIALIDRWQWKLGIALKDWRYVVRIANIDISDLKAGTGADLIDAMENAQELLPTSMGRRAFYMNRTVKRLLRKQSRTDVTSGGGLTFENFDGRPVLAFGDVPVRTVDALLNTEARVV